MHEPDAEDSEYLVKGAIADFGLLFAPQHEGREITAGEKWIIRTDLCVRR